MLQLLRTGYATGRQWTAQLTWDIQVLRYSALGAGVFYGFYHRTINQTIHAKHAEQEYKHKQELIEKARAEFAKSKSPVKTESKGDSACKSRHLLGAAAAAHSQMR
jgi:hypothetical protein